jgi:quaternary ammonium compound-resistance protein SugE
MANGDNALHVPTRIDSIMTLSTYVPSLVSAWALVAVSGAFEVVFALMMKESDGFNKLTPSAIAVAAALVSIWLMTISLRTLALGPAYAVWAGIGTLGTAIAAIVMYSEPLTVPKAIFMLFVLVGIVGLQLQGAE